MVTVLFPKASAYINKGLEEKRILDSIFDKYMKMLIDNNCFIEYLLEDDLARNYFSRVSYKKKRAIACVCKEDYVFFNSMRDKLDLSDKFYEEYETSTKLESGVASKYKTPMELMFKDRESYISQRVSNFAKRQREAITDLILCLTQIQQTIDVRFYQHMQKQEMVSFLCKLI